MIFLFFLSVYLQDHDVPEDKIFLLSLLMAEMGVHSVAYAFPKVRIITTAVDKEVNDQFHIIPGIGEDPCAASTFLCLPTLTLISFLPSQGNFGDRYFGTDAPSDLCESDEGMDYWWEAQLEEVDGGRVKSTLKIWTSLVSVLAASPSSPLHTSLFHCHWDLLAPPPPIQV